MRRLLLFIFCICAVCLGISAQNNVTKFLGIPVDGTKSEMIRKLCEKGYIYNSAHDCLEGEFNGSKASIYVQTYNNKVWRISVCDKDCISKTEIKIKFNNLGRQFLNNHKYVPLNEYFISDETDIDYEMLVHNKRFDGLFGQKVKAEDNLDNSDIYNRLVWFTIAQLSYDKYYICIFYENVYNKANGKEL